MSTEHALMARIAEIDDSLAAMRRAQGAANSCLADGRSLGSGARGVAASARALVAGSATGVDTRLARSLGATEANARAFVAVLERALADLHGAARRLEAEQADCRRELERLRELERQRAIAAQAMRKF